MKRHRSAINVQRTLAVAAALVMAFFAGRAVLANQHANTRSGLNARPDCLQVTVVSSQEKSALLAQLANLYDATNPQASGRCVQVSVREMASGAAETALARGWSHPDRSAPTVWTPAASSWLEILSVDHGDMKANARPLVSSPAPSLMQSPLVLAMPRPLAEALGWPNTGIGFSDVVNLARDPAGWARYGHPAWGRFKLGKTSPDKSTSGLNALVASYYAGTGLSQDLTTDNVSDPKVQAFVRSVESSVVHYSDTVSTFLDALKAHDGQGQAASYISAIATEETQVISYNARKPNTPLAAVYPKEGTLLDDHPYAILNAGWVSPDQRSAAQSFLKWLLEPAQQQRFRDAGFRDSSGHLAATLGQAQGVVPDGFKTVLKPPAPVVLNAIRDSWSSVRKRVRVLMVIDVSGSMEGEKLNDVKAAADDTLNLFQPDDQVGLWEFSDSVSHLSAPASVGESRSTLRSEIDGLSAGGGTALYEATKEAVQDMARHYDPERINAVILLTDGNETNGGSLDDLVSVLSHQSPDRSVRVYTIAYGSDADTQALSAIATASGGRAYVAPQPNQINRVFTSVVSNF